MVSIRIAQKPGAPKGCGNYEFRIKDNGIGINKEFQKHIFEEFTREESSTVSGIQGTGLGLSITKNIVDLMGGTIALESEPGKGSEFIVNLCFTLSGQKAEIKQLPQLEGLRALVADDDTNTCLSVSTMLPRLACARSGPSPARKRSSAPSTPWSRAMLSACISSTGSSRI